MVADIPRFAFEAAGPAAGFYYQLRYGLLRALKQARRDPTGSVSIERLDDVSTWSGDEAQILEQLKHTASANAVITDYSDQVWRTIGNWISLIEASAVSLERASLFLVTNSNIAENSGIAGLSVDKNTRDVDGAIIKLLEVAGKSTNQATATDRQRFVDLDESTRIALLEALTVVPDSPGLAALGSEIEDIIYYACEADRLAEFREELEGWWLGAVSAGLAKGTPVTVSLLEVDGRVSTLREKYKRTELTIDDNDDQQPADDLTNHVFVQQMRAVNANGSRLRRAQKSFLRAGTQRSKWLRELKLDPEELDRYDAELEDHWAAHSAIMHDDLGEASEEVARAQAGRKLLGWAETHQVSIRGATAQFLTSGTFHALADEVRVGWHPDFKTMFKKG